MESQSMELTPEEGKDVGGVQQVVREGILAAEVVIAIIHFGPPARFGYDAE
jgi:hypothetical protein